MVAVDSVFVYSSKKKKQNIIRNAPNRILAVKLQKPTPAKCNLNINKHKLYSSCNKTVNHIQIYFVIITHAYMHYIIAIII